MIALLLRAGRWLWRHPKSVGLAIVAFVVAAYRWRARRAETKQRAAETRAVEAEASAGATSTAIERSADGQRTEREVIDAAKHEEAAHPDDPEAAGRGADRYARERYERLRREHPDRVPAGPVRGAGGPAAGTAPGAAGRRKP